MTDLDTRKKGNIFEDKAVSFLEEKGCRILERNYRNRAGEIDIIGKDGQCLVFFEVKARINQNSGYAAEAVTRSKQRKICKVSDHYRTEMGIREDTQIRFDVIAVDGNEISWIKNAFDYIGSGF
ncbi:MAG: YraN family protein [Lachnospiraceae bacterium]|nr:YraN family protein [Lachnospiraceae bacterium]